MRRPSLLNQILRPPTFISACIKWPMNWKCINSQATLPPGGSFMNSIHMLIKREAGYLLFMLIFKYKNC